MKNIVIIGASGYSRVLISTIEQEKKYKLIGLLDTYKNPGEKILGYEILGPEEIIPNLVKERNLFGGVIAIGDNWVRYKVYKRILSIYPKFNFVTIIHPSAQIGFDVTIGAGSVITAGVVINPSISIGKQCLLNVNSTISHDSFMGDFSSLAPGATTGGNVKIGDFTAVSLGANIIHGITIGSHTVIGAGSAVVKDIPSYSVAYGVPAKVIRSRKKGEKYL